MLVEKLIVCPQVKRLLDFYAILGFIAVFKREDEPFFITCVVLGHRLKRMLRSGIRYISACVKNKESAYFK
jgi:hypothetical protein